MFTGKARKDTQSSPSDIVKDLDPAIERLILRCLEEEPKRRPSSALNVAMALPGADPIAAALAAGETPSPEMVAASQEKEGFSVRAAVWCFFGIIAAMAAGLVVHGTFTLLARAPLTLRPDALADRVQQLLRNIGYTAEPGRTTYGYYCCDPGVRRALAGFDTVRKSKALASHRPAITSFFYSQQDSIPGGPRRQTANRFRTRDAQPPGHIRVQLDAKGRLLRFEAQPRPESANVNPVDWGILFSAAGLDMARFAPATPRNIPEVAIDSQTAWEGDNGDGLTRRIRVEAASWRNRPVEFRVVLAIPQREDLGLMELRVLRRIAVLALPVSEVVLVVGALIIAWRNLRQGRTDKRGANIIAAALLALVAADRLLQPDHIFYGELTPWPLVAAAGWVAYIATEPYVRRHWPDSLISWSRLCSGKIRNPLVASHVLAGLLIAAIWGMVVSPTLDMAAGYGNLPGVAVLAAEAVEYLGGFGELISYWSYHAWGSLLEGVVLLVAIVLLRLAIRKMWAADLAAAVVLAVLIAGPRPQAAVLLPAWLGFMWLLRRFGLLSFLVAYMIQRTLGFSPLSVTDWAGSHFLPVHLLPVLVAAWALWVILSSQRRPATETAG
jgi:serine/threonine-protein kinase